MGYNCTQCHNFNKDTCPYLLRGQNHTDIDYWCFEPKSYDSARRVLSKKRKIWNISPVERILPNKKKSKKIKHKKRMIAFDIESTKLFED